MPKVLRIINRFNLGGPTYNATFLTRFLDKDFETMLIGGLPEKHESDSLLKSMELHLCSSRKCKEFQTSKVIEKPI
jgi:hypothetical protein